jgi:predicted thioesterase
MRWPKAEAASRSQLDRVLDPGNLSIQLDTLIKAASAVGRTVEIRLKRDTKRARITSA